MVRTTIPALLAWLIIATAAGADPPRKAAIDPRAANGHASSPKQSAATSREPASGPYPDVKAEGCYESDHESADLCAQWRAALAAEKSATASQWGNWIGALGALLSLASILLVLRALRQGRDANRLNMKEAARSSRRAVASAKDTEAALAVAARNAEAAAAQVKVAKESSEAQLRAWVVFDSLVSTEITENGQMFFDVAVQWKNVGRTPSRNVQIGIAWKTFAPGVAVSGHDKPQEFPECISGVLGPGLTAWSPVFRLTRTQFFAERMSIVSRCTYEDVFSRRKRVSETHVEAFVIRTPQDQYAIRWQVIGETTAT